MRALACVLLCGCNSLFGLHEPVLVDATPGGVDVRVDMLDQAPPPGPWVVELADLPDAVNINIDDPSLTDDMLELYFNANNDIWVAKRTSHAEPWSNPTVVVELSSTVGETTPEVTGDGLAILFAKDGGGTLGDLYFATRASRTQPWSTPAPIPELNTGFTETAGSVSTDQRRLLFSRLLTTSAEDIYIATRSSSSVAWDDPIPFTEVNSSAVDVNAFERGDELYIDTSRLGSNDLFVAKRINNVWQQPQPIDELNTASAETDPWVSPDGRTMYFASTRDGGESRIYMATR